MVRKIKKAKGVDKNVVKNKRHKELVGLSLIEKNRHNMKII